MGIPDLRTSQANYKIVDKMSAIIIMLLFYCIIVELRFSEIIRKYIIIRNTTVSIQ